MWLTALAIVLAVSLAFNGILAARLTGREDTVARLGAQIAVLNGQVEALRAEMRSAGEGGSPLERVAAAIERIRGLRFRKAVDAEILTAARLRERIAEEFRKEGPDAGLEGAGKVLVTLGLLPPGLDLPKTLLALSEEQVVGFYDDKTKKLVVAGEDAKSPGPLARVELAHEYVHALTDQSFDLSRLDKLRRDDKDEEAAALLALVEGDATLTDELYRDQVLTDDERRRLVLEAGMIDRSTFDAVPEFLQRELLFPYREGLDFARALYDRGGFDLVNQAYRDPPVSTEQILHPARYLDRRDDPTPVTMPDVPRALGKGWKEIDRGGIGELDVLLLADAFLPAIDSKRTAEGWDGGRYVGVGSGAGTLVAVLTAWDSEAEAREAAEGLGRWLPLRFGNEGSDMALEGALGRGWRSQRGAGAVLRSGSRVLLLVGPEPDAVRRARGAFNGF